MSLWSIHTRLRAAYESLKAVDGSLKAVHESLKAVKPLRAVSICHSELSADILEAYGSKWPDLGHPRLHRIHEESQ